MLLQTIVEQSLARVRRRGGLQLDLPSRMRARLVPLLYVAD